MSREGRNFGCETEHAISWLACKVLNAIYASVILALARAGAAQLDAGIEARLECDRPQISKHASVASSFHENLIAQLEVLSSSWRSIYNLGRGGLGMFCKALPLLIRVDRQ